MKAFYMISYSLQYAEKLKMFCGKGIKPYFCGA
jgi:hypothetical protein